MRAFGQENKKNLWTSCPQIVPLELLVRALDTDGRQSSADSRGKEIARRINLSKGLLRKCSVEGDLDKGTFTLNFEGGTSYTVDLAGSPDGPTCSCKDLSPLLCVHIILVCLQYDGDRRFELVERFNFVFNEEESGDKLDRNSAVVREQFWTIFRDTRRGDCYKADDLIQAARELAADGRTGEAPEVEEETMSKEVVFAAADKQLEDHISGGLKIYMATLSSNDYGGDPKPRAMGLFRKVLYGQETYRRTLGGNRLSFRSVAQSPPVINPLATSSGSSSTSTATSSGSSHVPHLRKYRSVGRPKTDKATISTMDPRSFFKMIGSYCDS